MPTLNYQVAAGADDCFWNASAYSNSATYLIFGREGATAFKSAARFTGVTIPVGAVITSAHVSFYYRGSTGTPPACTLSFEDAANPGAISSLVDGNSRTLTTENISITGPTSGTWWNSGSIVDIIQELVDSYSYASGAAMQCIVVCSSEGTWNYSYQQTYDYDPTLAAKLYIEWSYQEIEEFAADTAVQNALSTTAAVTKTLSAAGAITPTLDEDAAATITSSKSTAITTTFSSDTVI